MNWYKKFLISEKIQKDESNFSWLRMDVPKKIKDIHANVLKEIKDEDLYIVEHGRDDWSYGKENMPHITVKFGMEFDEPDKVIESLKEEGAGTFL